MLERPCIAVGWNDTEIDAKDWLCAYNFVGRCCADGSILCELCDF